MDTYAHPKMMQLLDALRLPMVDKVPATWQPPRPAFLDAELENAEIEADEQAAAEAAAHAQTPTDAPGAQGDAAPDALDVENVHTAYGTAKQWTRNVDHVMSGLCKWLNGAESRDPYRADSEDFIFMQKAIGEYLKTLQVNLDPKAAMYAAIIVVYIGHIATGAMYRGKQLWAYGVKWWKERKAKAEAEAAEAKRKRERQEYMRSIVEALKGNVYSDAQAEAVMADAARTFDEQTDAPPVVEVAVAEEVFDDGHGNMVPDPDFRPRATDPTVVQADELRHRRANRYCLLPECTEKLTGRNKTFCCTEHRTRYTSYTAKHDLPKLQDL